MKIAMVTFNAYWNLTGGVEVHAWELAKALSHLGHEVHFFFANSTEKEYFDPESTVFVHSIKIPIWGKINSSKRRFALEFFNFVVHQKVKNNYFDIIHSQNFDGVGILNFSIPLVITIHTTPYQRYLLSKKKFPKRILNTMSSLLEHYKCSRYSCKAQYISVSSKVQLELKKIYSINSVVISNGVNPPHKIDKNTSKKKLGIEKWKKVILFFSRVTAEKGPHKLLPVIDNYNDVGLLVAGTGPFIPQLERLVGEHSLTDKVKILGYVKKEELKYVFSASDCFALPSDQAEGQPISILEAMSYGLPCFVTSLNWIPDYLRSYALEGKVLDSVPELLKMGEQNSCVMTWEDVAKETEKIYQNCLC